MVPATITFHRLAAEEFRQARSSYARQSGRATLQFIRAVDVAMQQIAADPERWPLYDGRHRWVKTKKFPYILLYRPTGQGRLTIVAVAHTSRRPGYWRGRLA